MTVYCDTSCMTGLFEARNIKTMELAVMETLNWRLHICNFLDKFSEWSSGKDGSRLSACRSRPSAAYIVSLQSGAGIPVAVKRLNQESLQGHREWLVSIAGITLSCSSP
jgi:hypothetical protein